MQELCTNPIVEQLQDVVNFLSAAVGVIVVVMIIYGGIRYASAGDNPQAVADAKNHITNALIALLVFMFMFAFLQWLIPGGIFDGCGGAGGGGGGGSQPPPEGSAI